MNDSENLESHYTHGDLLAALEAGISALGKTTNSISVDDLAPADEFHIGGRQASIDFLDQLGLDSGQHVLDVGCGLGGPARFTATRYGCNVTGIDLTEEFVTTGNVLNRWLSLDSRVSLDHGSATDMTYPPDSFDAAYMLHVGMNIADKSTLCESIFAALKPGGQFGIYDIMEVGAGELDFPVPWSSAPATSAVATTTAYRDALQAAGFTVTAERNRAEFAINFFEELKARMAGADGPPPLGLHIVMGANAPVKVQNVMAGIVAGHVAPVEMIATKPV